MTAAIIGIGVGHQDIGGSEIALTEETGAMLANGDATEIGDKESAAVNEEPVAHSRRVLA